MSSHASTWNPSRVFAQTTSFLSLVAYRVPPTLVSHGQRLGLS